MSRPPEPCGPLLTLVFVTNAWSRERNYGRGPCPSPLLTRHSGSTVPTARIRRFWLNCPLDSGFIKIANEKPSVYSHECSGPSFGVTIIRGKSVKFEPNLPKILSVLEALHVMRLAHERQWSFISVQRRQAGGARHPCISDLTVSSSSRQAREFSRSQACFFAGMTESPCYDVRNILLQEGTFQSDNMMIFLDLAIPATLVRYLIIIKMTFTP